MKCLINCPAAAVAWVERFFPGSPAYLIKIANKPYLEYLIDFCVFLGIREIRIITDAPDRRIQEYFGDGLRWNVAIHYATTQNGMDLLSIKQQNLGMVGTDSLLVLHGFFWLNYDKRNIQPLAIAPDRVMAEQLPDGFGMRLVGRLNDSEAFWRADQTPEPLTGYIEPLSSIQEFYRRNLALVYGEAERYVMPSYNNTPQIYIGSNVAIPRSAELSAPLMLGSSIQLGDDVKIGPGAIIGDSSYIDSDAQIIDSIVMGNSYVGYNLELKGKIIYRNLVIEPDSESILDIVDEFLLTPLEPSEKRKFCSLVQRGIALLLFLVLLLPFCLLRPFLKVHSTPTDCFFDRNRRKKIHLRLYVKPARSFAGRYFRKLSLDRFHLLPLVWRGELRLVGNRIYEASPENFQRLQQFPDYAPGIFSFCEMLDHEWDPIQSEIDELYYIYHASFRFNWMILRRTLLRNLLKRQ